MNRTRLMGRTALVIERIDRQRYPLWDDAMLTEECEPFRSWGGVRLRVPWTRFAVTVAREGGPPWSSPWRAVRNRWRRWRWVRAGRPLHGVAMHGEEAEPRVGPQGKAE